MELEDGLKRVRHQVNEAIDWLTGVDGSLSKCIEQRRVPPVEYSRIKGGLALLLANLEGAGGQLDSAWDSQQRAAAGRVDVPEEFVTGVETSRRLDRLEHLTEQIGSSVAQLTHLLQQPNGPGRRRKVALPQAPAGTGTPLPAAPDVTAEAQAVQEPETAAVDQTHVEAQRRTGAASKGPKVVLQGDGGGGTVSAWGQSVRAGQVRSG